MSLEKGVGWLCFLRYHRASMILITGATGFVGRRLTKRLAVDAGLRVRVLLRPGADANTLPRGAPLHVMMGDIRDSDSLLAAMDGVHTVIHLVSTEKRGRYAMLDDVDIEGTRRLVEAAATARVGRILAVSRLGADTASAFPVQRAKGEIERIVSHSGLSYTIIRSAVLFGQGDLFSEHIAMLARAFPVFLVPGEGEMVLQPLWVEDLVTCLAMSLQDLELLDRTITVGGPELLSYQRIVMRVMRASRSQRPILGVPVVMARALAWYLDGLFARWPFNEFWIELLATAQAGELGSIERQFGFRPAAFDIGLIDEYMQRRLYGLALLRYVFTKDW
jgi:uncharacterized protein YbjT (DUF2867 family)